MVILFSHPDVKLLTMRIVKLPEYINSYNGDGEKSKDKIDHSLDFFPTTLKNLSFMLSNRAFWVDSLLIVSCKTPG